MDRSSSSYDNGDKRRALQRGGRAAVSHFRAHPEGAGRGGEEGLEHLHRVLAANVETTSLEIRRGALLVVFQRCRSTLLSSSGGPFFQEDYSLGPAATI